MPVKIETKGFSKVLADLTARSARARAEGNPRLEVGFSASYAMFVHENLQRTYRNGQAKFLETPQRRLKGEMQAIVRNGVRRGMTLRQALYQAGLLLLAAAQKLCPVRTGHLRASGFVKVH